MLNKTLGSTKLDRYTSITNEIIRAIEAGAADFEMPWHKQAQAGLPRNPVTKQSYRGINTLTLWIASRKDGFASPYWASYLQGQTLGAQVQKGVKGSTIVFYKRLEEDEDTKDTADQPKAVIRYSRVFNGDQVDNFAMNNPVFIADQDTFDRASAFITNLQSDVRHGSDHAYYSPALDRIFMPNQAMFRDTKSGPAMEGYYAVLFHEHIHWSGHKTRLERDLSGKFGSSAYAMEELVAELGASFLCATLDINTYPRRDHAAYIASWLKVLKEHKTAIFTAAAAASRASLFLESLAKEDK